MDKASATAQETLDSTRLSLKVPNPSKYACVSSWGHGLDKICTDAPAGVPQSLLEKLLQPVSRCAASHCG